MRKISSNFPLRGGGVPPLSAKGFLAKLFSVKGVGGAQWAKSGGEAVQLELSDFTKDPM